MKKNMGRLVTLLLVVSLLLSMTACGGDHTATKDASSETVQTSNRAAGTEAHAIQDASTTAEPTADKAAADTEVLYNGLFDSTLVHTVDVTITEADWDDLRANPLSKTKYEASVTIDGETLTGVSFATKGNTSLSSVASDPDSDRYSFKLNFGKYNKGQSYHGLNKLSLNNLYADATCLKDYLSYELFRQLGVDAPLTSYVWLRVNGTDQGLYLAIEDVSESWLDRTQNGEGVVYKPETEALDQMGNGEPGGDGQKPDGFPGGFPSGQSGDGSTQPTPPDGSSGSFPGGQGGNGNNQGGFPGGFPGGQSGDGNMPTPPDGSASGFPGGQGGNGNNQGSFPGGFPGGQSGDGTTQPTPPDGNSGGFPGGQGGNGNNQGGFPGGFPGGQSGDGTMPTPPDGDGSGFPGQMDFGGSAKGADLRYTDDDPESYSDIFDNDETDMDDGAEARVIAALKALSEGSPSEALDTEEVIRYFAAHNFVLNYDSYTGSMLHNYYLYEKDGKLSMIPWDYNLAFGGFGGGPGENMGGNDASSLVNTGIDSPLSGSAEESRPMWAWIAEDETCLAQYHAALDELLQQYFENGTFEAELERMTSLIRPYVEKDPTAFYTVEEFDTAVETLKQFCLLRAESIRKQLDGSLSTQTSQQEADARVDASGLNVNVMGGMGGERDKKR